MCKPVNEEILGIRILEEFNEAGLFKGEWELAVKGKHWADFMHNRFFRNGKSFKLLQKLISMART